MMYDLCKFFKLVPRDAVHRVLSEWLDLSDVCRLDSAIANKSLRRVYLNFLSDSSYRFRLRDSVVQEGVSVECLRWVGLRRLYLSNTAMKMTGIARDGDMHYLPIRLMKIESLDLSGCEKLTNVGLKHVAGDARVSHPWILVAVLISQMKVSAICLRDARVSHP